MELYEQPYGFPERYKWGGESAQTEKMARLRVEMESGDASSGHGSPGNAQK